MVKTINTTRFGEVEVQDKSLFNFVIPILGYDDENEFILLEQETNSNFKWLQSVKTPELAFAVTVASFWDIPYSFTLDDNVQDALNITSAEDIAALNIAVIQHDNPRKSTISLLAPIIINFRNHKAGQIILSGSDLEVECPLFKDEKE